MVYLKHVKESPCWWQPGGLSVSWNNFFVPYQKQKMFAQQKYSVIELVLYFYWRSIMDHAQLPRAPVHHGPLTTLRSDDHIIPQTYHHLHQHPVPQPQGNKIQGIYFRVLCLFLIRLSCTMIINRYACCPVLNCYRIKDVIVYNTSTQREELMR